MILEGKAGRDAKKLVINPVVLYTTIIANIGKYSNS